MAKKKPLPARKAMLSASFEPLSLLERSLRNWWMIALGFLLGGVLGSLTWTVLPPVYESGFAIPSSIDFTITGELTQMEEDLAMEAAGAALSKPAIKEKLAATAGLPFAEVNAMLRAERRIGTWIMTVRSPDAALAELLAGEWLVHAHSEIAALRTHAVAADALSRRLSSLEDCLAHASAAEPSQALCGFADTQSFFSELKTLTGKLNEEKALSQGVSSGVVFGEIPSQPDPARIVIRQRGLLTLAGALIGLLAGIAMALSLPRNSHG